MRTRTLSTWALGATVFLVAFGGFTRGSGSGYGCQDRWPLCEDGLLGGLLPRADFHMIIEWTHRWLAAIVGVLAVATAVVAWRTSRRWIAWVATSAIGVIGVQAWVGRLIVVRNLDADLVSLHLTISMTVAAAFAVIVTATSRAEDVPAEGAWVLRFGIAAALSFLVLLLGSLVHNIYVPGWPLTLDQLIPDLGARTIAIHFFHRVAAAVAFGYLVWLARRAHTAARSRPERLLVMTALGAFVVNIALGAAHVFTRVDSSALVATHLGVATIAWVALVGATTLSTGVGARPGAGGAQEQPVVA